jgi:hypothetical protein
MSRRTVVGAPLLVLLIAACTSSPPLSTATTASSPPSDGTTTEVTTTTTAPTTTGAPTTTVAPTSTESSTTTTAEPTTTSAPAPVDITLHLDNGRFVEPDVTQGTAADDAVSRLVATLGPPDTDTGWVADGVIWGCVVGALNRGLEWSGFQVQLATLDTPANGGFVNWRFYAPTTPGRVHVVTTAGATIGTPQDSLSAEPGGVDIVGDEGVSPTNGVHFLLASSTVSEIYTNDCFD